jgi:TRAP-type C4-dicarboxylate transport system substrate-binding protein
MVHNRYFLIIPAVAAVLVFFTGCSRNSGQVITLRVNSQSPDFNADGSRVHQFFIDEVEKNSNGRIRIEPCFEFSPGETPEAVIGGIRNRSFELISCTLDMYVMHTDAFLPLAAPYLIASDEMAYNLVSGDPGRGMTEKCEADTGIKMLYYNLLGFHLITNSLHPVVRPNDLQGLKIRVWAHPFHTAIMNTYGASVITMPFPDLFVALETKTLDGQENTIMNIRDFRLHEVQTHITKTGHLYSFAGTGINADVYHRLAPELRDAIDRAAAAAQERTLRELQEAEAEAYRNIGDALVIVELTESRRRAFRTAAQPLLARLKIQQNSVYFSSMVERIQNMR